VAEVAAAAVLAELFIPHHIQYHRADLFRYQLVAVEMVIQKVLEVKDLIQYLVLLQPTVADLEAMILQL
jgi:hypothetical protein